MALLGAVRISGVPAFGLPKINSFVGGTSIPTFSASPLWSITANSVTPLDCRIFFSLSTVCSTECLRGEQYSKGAGSPIIMLACSKFLYGHVTEIVTSSTVRMKPVMPKLRAKPSEGTFWPLINLLNRKPVFSLEARSGSRHLFRSHSRTRGHDFCAGMIQNTCLGRRGIRLL